MLLTNPFSLFYLLLNFKLPVLGTNLGSKAKKLRIRVPTDRMRDRVIVLSSIN
jgi:hypothetical protein